MPTISIIVPVYKAEKHLRRCVDSILAQTFTDFELMLVDDGSPDRSGVICDEYAAKDRRIQVIHKANGGVSSARNTGLDCAKGSYILFCDSDDYVSRHWCESLLSAAVQNRDAFITCNLWHDSGNAQTLCRPEKSELEKLSYFDLYQYGISPYVWNKIYDARKISDHHLRFDESCHFAEDVGFNAKYCALCSSCIYVPTALYYYVNNPGSAMHYYYPDYFSLHLPIFWCRLPLISERELPEYCDIWLYHFLGLFDNVFDSRCNMNLCEKLRYNQRMIQCEEFRFCLVHATGKNESSWVMKILRTHNYYLFWLFNQLVRLKENLRRK